MNDIEFSIGNLVRRQENDYITGTTQHSKYVSESMYEDIEKTEAYLHSKHTTGEYDSQDRKKPFANISIIMRNVWYRATDIDRKHIKIRQTEIKKWLKSFLYTQKLQQWMRDAKFARFLNKWGLTLAGHGSAIVKFVESGDELNCSVMSWTQMIVDPVDFYGNAQIEIIELNEGQLRQRIESHGYDKDVVESLTESLKARETLGKNKKDTKNDFIRLYEVHGMLSKKYLTGKDSDENIFTQQMHVVSFVGNRKGRKIDFEDFTLMKGEEERSPYMLTHLIEEDGHTLSIGAVKTVFQAQWQYNDTIKKIRDAIDLASKTLFQTSDAKFLGRNVLSHLETGDILIHAENKPLTQINNTALNLTSTENYAAKWKQLGAEIAGVSEAMLGAQPKAGSAWRQTEALLDENYSLFEQMTENKGLHIDEMMREFILPFIRRKMLNNEDEIIATLEQSDITKIDSLYIPNKARKNYIERETEKVLNGEIPQMFDIEQEKTQVQEELQMLGNQRGFLPPKGIKWKEYLADVEDDTEIDITGEVRDVQAAMTTLNSALLTVMNPGYAQNKQAQAIVGKVLELSGTLSPVELGQVSNTQAQVGGSASPEIKLPEDNTKRNI